MPSREHIDLYFGSPYEEGSQHPDARRGEPGADELTRGHEPTFRPYVDGTTSVECECGWDARRPTHGAALIAHEVHVEDALGL